MLNLSGLLCIVWFTTILAGFYVLYCPIIYLMFLHHRTFRVLADMIFEVWEFLPVFLLQCILDTKIHYYGDYFDPDENCIIVMNHRTRLDWNYIWLGLYHSNEHKKYFLTEDLYDFIFQEKSKTKFVLKDDLKHLPGLGWILQLSNSLFVKRNWQQDERNLSEFVNYYCGIQRKYRIILFPEGTDLNQSSLLTSKKYAVENSLPLYDNVLQPRTKGWTALCTQLRKCQLQSVYDVTIAYDTPAQTEFDALTKLPKNVHIYFKRYAIEDLPEDEGSLKKWLTFRWSAKELSLLSFLTCGEFEDENKMPPPKRRNSTLQKATLAFVIWSFVDIIFIYNLVTNNYFQVWVIYNSLLFVFVTLKFGGFQNLQYNCLQHS